MITFATCKPSRASKAFTLLELTVVMAVLGLIAVAATTMLGSKPVVDSLKAKQEAQLLAGALRTARTTAIANGAAVRIGSIQGMRGVVGYRLTFDSMPNVLLQPDYHFPEPLECRWSAPNLVFFSTGMTDQSLAIEIGTPATLWQVEVLSASGQVTYEKR
jgi:prepilin-type N-terminal cleavage/methylation domain-containing protein